MNSETPNCVSARHLVLDCEDILPEIFDYALDFDVTLPPLDRQTHLSFSQVNRMWRKIMLSSSRFWKSFLFKPAAFTRPVERLDIAQTLVRRSRGMPLSLSFVADVCKLAEARGGSADLQLRHILFGAGNIDIVEGLVIPNASRLVHLKYPVHGDERLRSLQDIPSNSFPTLLSIDITLINTSTDRTLDSITSLSGLKFPFESAPALDHLTCEVVGNQVNFVDFCFLPLDRLSKLSLERMAICQARFRAVIKLCCNSLVDGAFFVEVKEESTASSNHPPPLVEATSLKYLHIMLVNYSNDPGALDFLVLPILEELSIDVADKDLPFEDNIPGYTALVSNCTNSLQTFRLSDLKIDPLTKFPVVGEPGVYLHREFPSEPTHIDDLEVLFRTIPNVMNLSLPLSVHVPRQTLDRIANGTLLPCLETLELATKMDPSPIFDMVERRMNPAAASIVHSLFTFLSILLPSTFKPEETKFRCRAAELDLEDGCDLWFVPPCHEDECRDYCYFSSEMTS